MNTNLTRKEQKDKWLSLSKEAFVEDLLQARPKDYQERNHFYQSISNLLSYPLQAISILAGSYLLFDILRFVWQLDLATFQGLGVFSLCVGVFLGIEALRRWLVNTTGYNYFATLKISNHGLKKGEWIRSNLYILILISSILVSTGTIGVYQYIKHNSPEVATLDVKTVVSPTEQKISNEQSRINRLDQDIQNLLQAKKKELADQRSYALWKGQEYLLPEVKTRHAQYDRQIQAMNTQRQQHQQLIRRYEEKLTEKESQTQAENAEITHLNHLNKEIYAGTSAGIWLGFEVLLVFMLSYRWVYLYHSKREKLLEILEDRGKQSPNAPLTHQEVKATANAKKLPINGQSIHPYVSDNQHTPYAQARAIGFDKWYEKPQPEVIVKEVEVPIIKEVFIEKEITRADGFPVICAHCGQEKIKKRPAKYCSDTCRHKAWKQKQEHR